MRVVVYDEAGDVAFVMDAPALSPEARNFRQHVFEGGSGRVIGRAEPLRSDHFLIRHRAVRCAPNSRMGRYNKSPVRSWARFRSAQ
jgi:hypothetical protein